MFIYLHDRELPSHQGKKYPVLINLNHIESVRDYCGHALLWFHDDTGEERSFLAEESFESVVKRITIIADFPVSAGAGLLCCMLGEGDV